MNIKSASTKPRYRKNFRTEKETNRSNHKNLREMLSTLGTLRPLFNTLLNLIENPMTRLKL
jgi:hypothetical protein